ncbi:MAG: hypothetical protein QS721_13025 [Candidatus Endonucleobacter sp. (ex Gigantidas childressi)]|nr:hypothetical protein [Candidatus Endonucleobacter sp. (ex Gigantidas childressi)]
MKKIALVTSLVLIATANSYSDMIGAKAGYNFWKTASHGDAHNAYIRIEHSLPIVPNIGFSSIKIDNHDKFQLDTYDLFGYYEILDNGTLSLDIGAGARQLVNGQVYNQSFHDTLPMARSEVELLTDSTFSFYGNLGVGKSNSSSFIDAHFGVRFNPLIGITLQVSYREYHLTLDDVNGTKESECISGPMIGLHIDF